MAVVLAGKARIRGSVIFLAAVFLAAAASPPTAQAVTLTTLYDFCTEPNCLDGQEPSAPLVADAAGNLYGTVNLGGANGVGGVFALTHNREGADREDHLQFQPVAG